MFSCRGLRAPPPSPRCSVTTAPTEFSLQQGITNRETIPETRQANFESKKLATRLSIRYCTKTATQSEVRKYKSKLSRVRMAATYAHSISQRFWTGKNPHPKRTEASCGAYTILTKDTTFRGFQDRPKPRYSIRPTALEWGRLYIQASAEPTMVTLPIHEGICASRSSGSIDRENLEYKKNLPHHVHSQKYRY